METTPPIAMGRDEEDGRGDHTNDPSSSCFRNVNTIHELECARKVVTRSLPRFLMVHDTMTYRHMQNTNFTMCVRPVGIRWGQAYPRISDDNVVFLF